jgi:hypothetical protein
MKKKMSVEEYSKLTNSNKLEIERLVFETVKEEMENLFSFLTVEKIEFNNYWEKVDNEAARWNEISTFVLANGRTYIRLPYINDYMISGDRDVNYSKALYDIQENIFEFFGLPNTVMGAALAWGDEDYFD